MSLEYLTVPENTELPPKNESNPTVMGSMSGHRSQLKELPMIKAGII